MGAQTACNRRELFSVSSFGKLASARRSGRLVSELTVARRAMACEFSITFPNWVRFAAEAGYAALDEVDRLEQKLSVYIQDSELSYINRTATTFPVATDGDVYDILRRAAELSYRTDGAFDAASGALVKAWGFFLGPKRVPTEDERLAALAISGSRHVKLDDAARTVSIRRSGVEFNLGGIGKGYAIDRALSLLGRQHQVRSALMQGGQSSLCGIGSPAGQPRGWAVDIGHPLDPNDPIARVWLRDQALGTSSTANQFFVVNGKRYGHILDPRTGWPARKMLAASVIAPTATEADALSTAFFVLGLAGTREFLKTHPDTTAILVVPGKTAPELVVIGGADVEVFQ